ncbi:MAG: calcium-binding protein, partial [Oscillatoriales cyanobacterium RU_3_3]|nr:calcium-binding protein [Oscillatoriales cyanobacterium RU_3_3]
MATTSNGYNWNADAVLNQLIEERGKSKVIFINGQWTDWSPGFVNQRQAVEEAFGLWTINVTPTSLNDFKGIHNPSKGKEQHEAFNLGNAMAKYIFKPAVDEYRIYWQTRFPDAPFGSQSPDGIRAESFANENGEAENYAGFKIAKHLENGVNIFDLRSAISNRERLSDFTARFGNLGNVAERIGSDAPTDLMEGFSQIFSKTASPVSSSVNGQWSNEAATWLQNSNNSLIFVPHSQGNFFVEDGLLSNPISPARTRIISLGSPTNYSSLSGGYQVAHFPGLGSSSLDPVVKLRIDASASDRDKLNHLLTFLADWQSIISNMDAHSLQNVYLKQQNVKDKFEDFFYDLHPKGYYFPQRLVNQSDKKSTTHGDFIEGSNNGEVMRGGEASNPSNDKNDVLYGKDGNDTLSGDAGWDFLDGGSGTDLADYLDSSNGIIVHTEQKAGSSIYRIEDGYGQEDILVDIEVISGSNKDDKMTGGNGNDIFYAQGGKDLFWGQKGDDTFYGGTGEDKAYGGDDNDELRGEEGDDELRGENGEDFLYGGTGKDFLYGGEGNDELR